MLLRMCLCVTKREGERGSVCEIIERERERERQYNNSAASPQILPSKFFVLFIPLSRMSFHFRFKTSLELLPA